MFFGLHVDFVPVAGGTEARIRITVYLTDSKSRFEAVPSSGLLEAELIRELERRMRR